MYIYILPRRNVYIFLGGIPNSKEVQQFLFTQMHSAVEEKLITSLRVIKESYFFSLPGSGSIRKAGMVHSCPKMPPVVGTIPGNGWQFGC